MNSENTYITKQTLDTFSLKIGYNVNDYMDLYSYFIQNNKVKITDYYQKQDVKPDVGSFEFLDNMIKESIKIDNLIKLHKDNMDSVDFWDLLDFIEDIRTSLETISNSHRYLRSSKSKNSWRTTNVTFEHVMSQNETLEDIVEQQLFSQQSDKDWVNLAIQNSLSEEDYTPEGSIKLQLTKNAEFGKNYFLDSVIDTLVGEKVYGKDIYKKLTFEDNDLKVLSYTDTFIQSITILVPLKKGDIPEFKTMGVDPRLGVGSNINVFEYGKIVAQLQETIATDDTIRGFMIMNLLYDNNGSVFIKYEANSFYDLIYKNFNA